MSVHEATVLTLSSPLIGAKACCAPSDHGSAGPSAPVVALAGVPNTGKSTLFNALTGAPGDHGQLAGHHCRGGPRSLADHPHRGGLRLHRL